MLLALKAYLFYSFYVGVFCFYVSFFRGLTYYAHVLSSVRQSTDAQVFIDATANYLSSAQLTQTMAYDL